MSMIALRPDAGQKKFRVTVGSSPLQQRLESIAHNAQLKAEPLPEERPHTAPVVALVDLGRCMCRWPIGNPGDVGFGFCGKPAPKGDSYCAPHRARAYVKPKIDAKELRRSLRRVV